jgi:hypothetical protein
MNKLIHLAAALWTAAAIVAMPAGSEAQQYRVRGPGAQSCQIWSENRAGGNVAEATAMQAWVDGFVSAMNVVSAVNGRGPDIAGGAGDAGFFAWIDAYCAKHPLDHLSVATVALLQELDRRNAPVPAAP